MYVVPLGSFVIATDSSFPRLTVSCVFPSLNVPLSAVTAVISAALVPFGYSRVIVKLKLAFAGNASLPVACFFVTVRLPVSV